MGRTGIEQFLYMMDSAFEGEDWHSVLKNLRSVNAKEWDWVPPGGVRTIRFLIHDLGECKYVYDSHAFGDASVHWDKEGTIPPVPDGASTAEIIEWLRAAQSLLRSHLAAMPDDEALTEEVMSQWGFLVERRYLIWSVIEHDLYHAGEINHIGALARGNDGPGNDY
jgi:hypothetical protein